MRKNHFTLAAVCALLFAFPVQIFAQETREVIQFSKKGDSKETTPPVDEELKQGESAEARAESIEPIEELAKKELGEQGAEALSLSLEADRAHVREVFTPRESVLVLLNAHCELPSKEDFLFTALNAEELLVDISQDSNVSESIRSRAIRALGYFESAENEESLRQSLINSEALPRSILANQIRAYASVAKERGLDVLLPFLEHKEDRVRIVTITSLRDMPGTRARLALEDRLKKETNQYFQLRLRKAIEYRCERESCR